MTLRDDKHGIQGEPHFREYLDNVSPALEPTDPIGTVDQVERVEHTVWDEPTTPSDLATRIQPDITYSDWLSKSIAQTGWLDSWLITFLVACAAGPWGIIGAFAGANATGFAFLAVCVFGPVAEEISKVAAAMWVVEKRPYLFFSGGQILVCAACGGLAFAAIENLIYMFVYVPNHSSEFVAFRWTVCVALHVTCSTLAGIGLVQVWRDSITHLRKPRLELSYRWMAAAMIGHGVYNLTVTILESAGWLEFGADQPNP